MSHNKLSNNNLILKKMSQEGTVKFYNEAKGFGFIKPANGGKDVFVHASGLVDKVQENDEVTFDEQEGKKGVNAVNVQLAN